MNTFCNLGLDPKPPKPKRGGETAAATGDAEGTDSITDPDSGSESESAPEGEESDKPFKIPKKKSRVWSADQVENFKKNYPDLRNFDDSILAVLSASELAKMGGRGLKNSKILSEKLASNYEQVKTFPARVPEGVDDCTGTVHESRFLRGYLNNSQELWLQARRFLGLTGLPPVSHYETVSVGLQGLVTSQVWAECRNPSSKVLSIKMLAAESVKASRGAGLAASEAKDFATVREFKKSMLTLDCCIRRIYSWNWAFTTVLVFLNSVDFGEVEIAEEGVRLAFLVEFVDSAIQHNAQCWDEERPFRSALELATHWAASLMKLKCDAATPKRLGGGGGGGQRSEPGAGRNSRHAPKNLAGVCTKFNSGECDQKGDKHLASWDADYVLRHLCSKYVPEKKRYCLGSHAKKDHK